MGQLSHVKGSFSKCFRSKKKKVMLSFWRNFSAAWLFRYLVSSSLERKELRRCFEPKVFCFIPTPCWCTSTPSWCVGNYLPLTFSVLSRIVTTFFRLASLLKPVWVYTARRSSACSSVTRSIAGPSPFSSVHPAGKTDCSSVGSTPWRLLHFLQDWRLFAVSLVGSLMVLRLCFLGTLFAWRSHILVDEMADTPKRKITKKSSSFSYDRRRDSVKVRRQSKSLSFKSATLDAQKRQAKKKQVCVWLFLKKNIFTSKIHIKIVKLALLTWSGKQSADLQPVCEYGCVRTQTCGQVKLGWLLFSF